MSLATSNRDGGRTNEAGHLRAIQKIIEGEVLTGLVVSQRAAGANMSVDISIGDAVIPRSDGSYGHPAWADAIYNQVIATADGSNPRRDIIVMYIDYGQTPSTGVSNNTNGVVKIKSVAGTPAGSPADPDSTALQASVGSGNPYIKLARVRVATSASSISNSVIDDLRTMATIRRQRTPVEGMLSNVRYYTAGATYTKPAGLKFVEVELQAGGGGCGQAGSTSSGQVSEASGGGGGEYARKRILASDLGDTETVTVGAGGVGATSGTGSGGNGGTSSFGSHFAAAGGVGGQYGAGTSGNYYNNGGTGGTGGSGTADMRIPGDDGGPAAVGSGSTFGFGRVARGGGAFLGSVVTTTGAAAESNSIAGHNYGGGAAGARNPASTSAKVGANGGAGIVIVKEYF